MKEFKIGYIRIIVKISVLVMILLNIFSSDVFGNEKRFNICYKIDKDYVYVLNEKGISIINIEDIDNISLDYEVKEDENIYNYDIFVQDNNLLSIGICYEARNSFINLSLYDTYDKKDVKKINTFKVRGNKYFYKERDGYAYIICVNEDLKGSKEKITILSINYNDNCKINRYNFSIADVDFIYFEEENMYLFYNEGNGNQKLINIHKFIVKGSDIEYSNKIVCGGSVVNGNHVNEAKGYLNIIVFDEMSNSYFFNILDNDLNMVSSKDFLRDDNITSILFDEDKCYVSSYGKIGKFIILDLSDNICKKTSVINTSTYINYMYKLDDTRISCIGNINRFDNYKNMNTDKVYTIIKNIGISVFNIDISDKVQGRILDEFFIKGVETRGSSSSDHNKYAYCKKNKILILPVSSINNREIDISSAMEVSSKVYSSFKTNNFINKGVYVFDLRNNDKIRLRCIYDLDLESQINDIDKVDIVNDDIIVFYGNTIKVFDNLLEEKSKFSY